MNRLDKIARRSKRVGGAIADLWGSHLVGSYVDELHVEKSFYPEKSLSRGDCAHSKFMSLFIIVSFFTSFHYYVQSSVSLSSCLCDKC